MNGIARAVDGIIATIALQFALKRTAARHKIQILNSGYRNYGASATKKSLLGWNYAGGGKLAGGYKREPANTAAKKQGHIQGGSDRQGGSKYHADKCCGAWAYAETND